MRLLFLTIITVLTVSFSTPSYAACGSSVGLGAIQKLLTMIGPAAKNMMYFEGMRLRCGWSGCRLQVKCKTNDVFNKLELTLTNMCAVLDAMDGGVSSALASQINTEITKLNTNITDVMTLKKDALRTGADVDNLINNPLIDVANSINNIANIMPKFDKSSTSKKWIRLSRRKTCTTKPAPEDQAAYDAVDAATSGLQDNVIYWGKRVEDRKKDVTAAQTAYNNALILRSSAQTYLANLSPISAEYVQAQQDVVTAEAGVVNTFGALNQARADLAYARQKLQDASDALIAETKKHMN